MTATVATLEHSRSAVLPALRDAVDKLDPMTAAQVRYHLGWADLDGTPVPGPGGKAVRPALALLSARAAGAPAEVGIPGAVAVELVHNFSLLHDDLMDGDLERRHRPTVWAVWGASSAILAGDALLALAHEVLAGAGTSGTGEATRLLAEATRELIRGQVDDLAFERRSDVTVEQCFDMAAGKTGALLSASAAIGAVLAGAPPDMISGLAAFGAHIGLAFQLVDDLLGIWGDPSVTGKPVFSDLRARKKSLPVTYAVAAGGRAGRELAAWLAGASAGRPAQPDVPDDAALRQVADLVDAGGGRRWAMDEANRRMELAGRVLDAALVPEPVRAELDALARFIVTREA